MPTSQSYRAQQIKRQQQPVTEIDLDRQTRGFNLNTLMLLLAVVLVVVIASLVVTARRPQTTIMGESQNGVYQVDAAAEESFVAPEPEPEPAVPMELADLVGSWHTKIYGSTDYEMANLTFVFGNDGFVRVSSDKSTTSYQGAWTFSQPEQVAMVSLTQNDEGELATPQAMRFRTERGQLILEEQHDSQLSAGTILTK